MEKLKKKYDEKMRISLSKNQKIEKTTKYFLAFLVIFLIFAVVGHFHS